MISEKNTPIGHAIEINGSDFTVRMISKNEVFMFDAAVHPPTGPRRLS
jgi:hypothetical protein